MNYFIHLFDGDSNYRLSAAKLASESFSVRSQGIVTAQCQTDLNIPALTKNTTRFQALDRIW